MNGGGGDVRGTSSLDEMPGLGFSGLHSPLPTAFSPATREAVMSRRKGEAANSTVDVKCVLLGDAAAGKTSLFMRVFRDEFTDNYKTTIGVDFCLLDYEILSVPFRVQLWDTAGAERFKALTYAYYRGARVVILTADVADPEAEQSVRKWHADCLSMAEMHNAPRPIIFVVITKIDLIPEVKSSVSAASSYRLSTYECQFAALCREIGAELWMTSSKLRINVSQMFDRIAAVSFDQLFSQMAAPSAVSNGEASPSRQCARDAHNNTRIRLKPVRPTGEQLAPNQGYSCCR